ncbi:hypothetical protein BGZ80_010673 [Entomortierella chlamydospora]|uniref:Ion transport domain-containing protein n=1 Tax=Entomortierella chlamydospora TaxID=101097 RepID=A0A9P6N2N7_9FUNG|nr:hypothetical protein BGZ80_010673 [Entomortierella chlamydospora]
MTTAPRTRYQSRKQKLHLRFDSQVTVRLNGSLYSSLTEQEATTGLDDRFGFHYVELERLTPDTTVDSGDVSVSGSYVAVLSATLSTAYVGIWDLESTLPTEPPAFNAAERLEVHRRSITSNPPMATTTIPLHEGDYDNMRLVRIAISYDGQSVVVYQQPYEGDIAPEEVSLSHDFRFPFRFFRVQNSFAVAELIQETPQEATASLVEDMTIYRNMHDMGHFIGYGKFIAKDKITPNYKPKKCCSPNNPGDYFVACTESRILIYDASSDWKRLYGIAIGSLAATNSRVLQLRTLFRSIEGPSFVWREDAQNVSVWDLVTGANRKYISVGNSNNRLHQNEIEHITVSKNGGNILVLAGKDWIKTFFMDSGIEICGTVLKNGHRILDINFLDEDKSLLVTMIKSTSEQSSVIMDALNLSFQHCAKRQFASSTYSIQHVTQMSERTGTSRDVKDLNGDDKYAMMVVNGNELEMLEIPQPGVFGLGGTLMDCKSDCAIKGYLGLNSHVFRAPGSNVTYRLVIDFEERDIENRRQKSVRVALVSVDENKLARRLMSLVPEPWAQFDVDEGDAEEYIRASFLGSWTQFIIVFSGGFQIWNLPDPTSNNRCELALVWVRPRTERNAEVYDNRYADPSLEIRVCPHGEIVQASWIDYTTGDNDTTYIRIPKNNWTTRIETLYCINSVPMLISCYSEASSQAQDAMVRYTIKHINHEPPEGTSDDNVILKIARTSAWKDCTEFLAAVFRSNDGKWIPRCTSPSNGCGTSGPDTSRTLGFVKGRSINSIVLLFKNSKKEPRSLPLAEQIIDYCIQEAKTQRDPAFLLPVLECLQLIAFYNPEIAINIVRRTAFIPVKDRNFVINNSMIAHSPQLSMEMVGIRRRKKPIYASQNSVFQLKSQLPRINGSDFSLHIEVSRQKIVDPLNETFKKQVYVAPYALLWHARDNRWDKDASIIATNNSPNIYRANRSLIRMVLGLVVDKMNPWSRQTIRANFTDLEYFDNPAIEALLQYKWNSFAHVPWAIRFIGQLIYYVLVLAVTFIQVYPDLLIIQLRGPLIAIVAMGSLFLYLELQQFLADHWKYIGSPYNLVDVLVFLLPAVGSIQLLINIPQDENTTIHGNSRVLSFSVLMIYTHLLFEMRIVRSVCNIVTIIISIVGKIQVFFAIFALSILAFTHSLLHLLMAKNHDCLGINADGVQSNLPDNCPEIDTDFPGNYLGALSVTYFLLAGRYDNLDKDLDSEDWAFHIMLAIYFFINVVLMLNILIALMNVAFSAGDDKAPLVWLDNRLRSVESAENISFAAPGLRERFDWFPQYIYYTASPRKVKAFEDKYPSQGSGGNIGGDSSFESHVHDDSSSATSDDYIDLESISLQEIDQQQQIDQTSPTEPPPMEPELVQSPLRIHSSMTMSPKSPSLTSHASGAYFAETEPFTSYSPQNFEARPQLPRHRKPSWDQQLRYHQRQQSQQQQQSFERRYRGIARQETGHSSNFLRDKNDEDGDGINDKFEVDDGDLVNDDVDSARGDESDFRKDTASSIRSRINQDERIRDLQQELNTVQENTEELRETVRGLESKLDKMTLMLEQLLQKQQ